MPGPFYTTGECLACDAPEQEAADLLAPLRGDNCDTYFVRQPTTPAEVERACRALEVCCVAALRYGGKDPNIIRRLGNDPEYCDQLLPGGPIPRPDWLAECLWSNETTSNNVIATQPAQIAHEQNPADEQVESAHADGPGAKSYDGFPLVEETRTDGWCYGAITEFNEPECHPNGCESGDGYVETPHGSRFGVIWSTGTFTPKWTCPLGEGSGVYEVAFPKPVRNIHDLVECFRTVLPELKALVSRVRATR